jgi:hypothetical protein
LIVVLSLATICCLGNDDFGMQDWMFPFLFSAGFFMACALRY